jgi:hypothetical protein
MYTGTLIGDLMATVERAERGAQQRRRAEEIELQRIFNLQTLNLQALEMQGEQVFAGAA